MILIMKSTDLSGYFMNILFNVVLEIIIVSQSLLWADLGLLSVCVCVSCAEQNSESSGQILMLLWPLFIPMV